MYCSAILKTYNNIILYLFYESVFLVVENNASTYRNTNLSLHIFPLKFKYFSAVLKPVQTLTSMN